MTREPQQQGGAFAILFVVCAATATALAAYLPAPFHNWWLEFTIDSTKALGFLLGTPVTSAADIMTVNGFEMRIITQCTALQYLIILATAILLYSRHTISYRIAGFVISSFIIIAANALRLIIVGVTGSISWDAFVIMHDYLWVAAFSLLILGIWIVWAERRLSLTPERVKRGAVIMFSCTAVYASLLYAMPFYGGAIANLSSPLFRMLAGDKSAGILFNGERMVYSYNGGMLSAGFAAELMAVALYIGLLISGKNYGKATIKRGISGLLAILCIIVIAIAGAGALAIRSDKNAVLLFLWTADGMLLELSVLWWMMKRSAGAAKQ